MNIPNNESELICIRF